MSLPPALLWAGGFFSTDAVREKDAEIDATLQIRNLSSTTTEDDRRTLFAQVGEVVDVRIIRDRLSGESRGFGFLSMSAQSGADKAVSRLNGCTFNGFQLKVSLAKPRAVRGTDSS